MIEVEVSPCGRGEGGLGRDGEEPPGAAPVGDAVVANLHVAVAPDGLGAIVLQLGVGRRARACAGRDIEARPREDRAPVGHGFALTDDDQFVAELLVPTVELGFESFGVLEAEDPVDRHAFVVEDLGHLADGGGIVGPLGGGIGQDQLAGLERGDRMSLDPGRNFTRIQLGILGFDAWHEQGQNGKEHEDGERA